MVNLSWLSSRVPPKVHNACTRWVLNGFHTARRYQSQCPCLFCQSPGSSDCIEHFVECPFILHCIHPSVRYSRDLKNMFFFLTTNRHCTVTFALLVFAIYNTHNYLRHNGSRVELKKLLFRALHDCNLAQKDRHLWNRFSYP